MKFVSFFFQNLEWLFFKALFKDKYKHDWDFNHLFHRCMFSSYQATSEYFVEFGPRLKRMAVAWWGISWWITTETIMVWSTWTTRADHRRLKWTWCLHQKAHSNRWESESYLWRRIWCKCLKDTLHIFHNHFISVHHTQKHWILLLYLWIFLCCQSHQDFVKTISGKYQNMFDFLEIRFSYVFLRMDM